MKLRMPGWIRDVNLISGGGGAEPNVCIMEFVSLIAPDTEHVTDGPSCVDGTLISLGIEINDELLNTEEARNHLIPFAPRFVGTKGKTRQLMPELRAWIKYIEKTYGLSKESLGWNAPYRVVDNTDFNSLINYATALLHKLEEWTPSHIDEWNEEPEGDEGVITDAQYIREVESLLDSVLPAAPILPEGKKLRWQRARDILFGKKNVYDVFPDPY